MCPKAVHRTEAGAPSMIFWSYNDPITFAWHSQNNKSLYTGHRAEHRTEAGASFLLLIIITKWSKNTNYAVSWQPTQDPTGFRYENSIIWPKHLFSGLDLEAKDGGINSSLWKQRVMLNSCTLDAKWLHARTLKLCNMQPLCSTSQACNKWLLSTWRSGAVGSRNWASQTVDGAEH